MLATLKKIIKSAADMWDQLFKIQPVSLKAPQRNSRRTRCRKIRTHEGQQ